MTAISMVDRKVFVDTGAYYAFLDRNDRHHRQAAETFRSMADVPQVTTDLIVAECFTLIRYRLGFPQAASFLDRLSAAREKGFVHIVYYGAEHEAAVREVLNKFSDQDLSYVDAFSLALLSAKGFTKSVFAFDHHFHLINCRVIPGGF
ncbi:type II toxin-antitoxin system VapC family toxin [Desulforudis sp. 1088]|uniref:type II toxin-antitoxin system VapC family toxin n=2 Tax=unclassified Candidatus Desulforudis TaxID=2635950 RepID=UPI003CE48577